MKEIPLAHGAMTYECKECGRKWRMFLECGVGSCGCTDQCHLRHKCDFAKSAVKSAMTMPFLIRCACGGLARHIDWRKDTKFLHPIPVFDHMRCFKLDTEGLKNMDPGACGIPILREVREG
jgi:hypothetical protein